VTLTRIPFPSIKQKQSTGNGGAENAGPENAGPENGGPSRNEASLCS